MKLIFKNLTWKETNDMRNVFKTQFINTIDGDMFINMSISEFEIYVNGGDILTIKEYKDGDCIVSRYIKVLGVYYEFILNADDELEYNEFKYFD